jgi:hypothetical protein
MLTLHYNLKNIALKLVLIRALIYISCIFVTIISPYIYKHNIKRLREDMHLCSRAC